jgi:Zn-dependent M16 (insulinase) family peptidase
VRGVNEELLDVLKEISISLRTLAEETKANRELKQEVKTTIEGLELSIEEMKENPFGLNKRN